MKNLIVSISLALCLSLPALAQEAGQQIFKTPEEASQALVALVAAGNVEGLPHLVGSNAQAMWISGDADDDKERHDALLKAVAEKVALVPMGQSLVMLEVGTDGYPLPVPLVKSSQGWYFDGQLGMQEVRARRIGRNELRVIRACQAFVDAERDYAALDPDGLGLYQFAQHFMSQPGKHDGLFWEVKPGNVQSPLGPFLAQAGTEGAGAGKPFHGYRYRILTRQGPNAPGGSFSYLVNGHMVAGFGLIAYPAEYGQTGIKTFLVGPSGRVYERDLKEQTATAAQAIDWFDPGEGWKRI